MSAAKKGAVEATVDTVGTAIGMLWDWLGSPPTKDENGEKKEPSILDLLPSGEPTLTDPTVRCNKCKQPISRGLCGCPPPDVIDVEGSEI